MQTGEEEMGNDQRHQLSGDNFIHNEILNANSVWRISISNSCAKESNKNSRTMKCISFGVKNLNLIKDESCGMKMVFVSKLKI